MQAQEQNQGMCTVDSMIDFYVDSEVIIRDIHTSCKFVLADGTLLKLRPVDILNAKITFYNPQTGTRVNIPAGMTLRGELCGNSPGLDGNVFVLSREDSYELRQGNNVILRLKNLWHITPGPGVVKA